MDTMKVLLGATIALLLGALAVSWQGMKTGVANSPASELARLKKQVKELQAEQDKLRDERDIRQLRSETGSIPTPGSNSAEIERMKNEMEAGKAAIRKLEEDRLAREASVKNAEELEMDKRGVEDKDKELRRARMISEALLIGKVSEFVEDAQYGGFVTFSVLMPEQVQTGTILAIRRKTGILGLLKVSDVTAEGAIANPLPGFGPVNPTVGDELILPPQY